MNIKQLAKKIEERLAETFASATELSRDHSYRRDFELTPAERDTYIEESKAVEMSVDAKTVARLVIELHVEKMPHKQPKIEDVTLKWRVSMLQSAAISGGLFLDAVKGRLHFKEDGEVGFSISTDSLIDARPSREIVWTGLNVFEESAAKIVDSLIDNMPSMTSRHMGLLLQTEYKSHRSKMDRIAFFGIPSVGIAAAIKQKI
jgi:hypothetical protein